MTIDPQHLMNRAFAPVEHTYTAHDTQLYALALGVGADPLDEAALPYVYEGVGGDELRALPTFANVLAYPGFWVREPDTGIDWRRLLHAEQQIVLHGPLPTAARVIGQTRVSALWDRGAAKGAFLQLERQVSEADSGRLLATVRQLTLLRGDGGFTERGQRGSEGAPPAPHPLPERVADAVCDLATLPQASLLYRLCGDPNPLHADPAVAQAAGFARPILHGMATMGVAAHAVLRALLAYDACRFSAMRVRFSAPALPGDTLRTELWLDPADTGQNGADVISLRTTAVERDVVVLNHGRVDLRPAD